jgi:hypothetical protein
MQVTIDSAEPMDKVLSVVAALYGVELAVSPGKAETGGGRSASPTPKTARQRRKGATKAVAAAGNGPRRARRAGVAKPDPAAVRNWARANGHTVKGFGRLPAAVIAAYVDDGSPTS